MRRTIRLRLLLAVLALLLMVGCQRGAEESGETGEGGTLPTLEPVSTPPTPVVEGDGEPGFGIDEQPLPAPGTSEESPPPADDGAFDGRFSDLRFAMSGNGMAQANFPEGTEEIYAIWNYDGMSASDTMERLWYHNDELYVERREPWDYLTYGSTGAVRDVYLYDYIDGIDPGQWRVELYLNGEMQLSESFTVGGP